MQLRKIRCINIHLQSVMYTQLYKNLVNLEDMFFKLLL